MDELVRMLELKEEGFYCSQILLILGLEAQGKSNPDLIRAMHGLAGGIGFSGGICGSLTGGACLLGIYAGKGTPEEQEEDARLASMIFQLVEWFQEEYVPQYGGTRCDDIVAGNPENMSLRCPMIVAATFLKVKELLAANGFEISGIKQ